VRELENCLQQMIAMHSGPLLQTGDLPSSLQNHLRAQRSLFLSASAAAGAGPSGIPPRIPAQRADAIDDCQIIPLMELERRAILGALQYTRGDRGVAANLLGIGRTTLYRKLKEYQMAV
jgi:DNA-binding NtrC family response regulator